jgi:SAM-dependent methyltransferase
MSEDRQAVLGEQGGEYNNKLALQTARYREAYHWSADKRVEYQRYVRMTRMLADLIAGVSDVAARGGATILDFGCGDGRGSFLLWQDLRDRGLMVHLVGIDIAAEAIRWAERKTAGLTDGSLRFLAGTLEDGLAVLDERELTPIVVMRELIEHLPDDEIDRLLSRLRQYRPDCTLLVTVPSSNSPVEEKHFRHYTPSRLKIILNNAPVFWRLMNACWNMVPPRWAITLVALARQVNEKPVSQDG